MGVRWPVRRRMTVTLVSEEVEHERTALRKPIIFGFVAVSALKDEPPIPTWALASSRMFGFRAFPTLFVARRGGRARASLVVLNT